MAVKLSYFPDEAHPDFAQALRLGQSWGLRYAEIRTVDGVNVLDLTPDQLARAKALLEAHGMQVSAVATPFFKCPLPGEASSEQGPLHGARSLTFDDHLALLARGVELARFFGARYLRLFAFWRREQAAFWEPLANAVQAALTATAGSDILPCLENESSCCVATSAELAEAARRFPEPRLRFIWDPGNSTYAGLPPRAEDVAVFVHRVAIVHLKDARFLSSQGKAVACLLGEGDTDYPQQLRLLALAGYDGFLTLEPHYRQNGDLAAGMAASVAALRRLADEAGVALT